MPSEVSIEQWYTALGSPSGVIVDCCGNDPEKVKEKLYAARKACGDPDLDLLGIVTSPTNPTKELWIVRKKNEAQV